MQLYMLHVITRHAVIWVCMLAGGASIRAGSMRQMYMMVAVARTLALARECVRKPWTGFQLECAQLHQVFLHMLFGYRTTPLSTLLNRYSGWH